jgi:DNA-binding beta-propeller fold protein YncE
LAKKPIKTTAMKKTNLISLFILLFSMINMQSQELQWAGNPSGLDFESANAVAIGPDGYIYVTGNFNSPEISFNAGTTSEITLVNSGGIDFFCAKYDKLSGVVLWAIAGNGSETDSCTGISITATGELYICGNFNSTDLSVGGVAVPHSASGGDFDFFFAKIDPISGDVTDAYNPSLAGIDETATGIAVNHHFGVYVSGYLGVAPHRDVFLNAYDPGTGTFLESVAIYGIDDDYASGISISPHGILYITGAFNSPLLEFPGSGIPSLSVSAGYDMFLLQADVSMSGIDLMWAISSSGDHDECGTAVAVDPSGNAYVTGYFDGEEMILPSGFSLSNSCAIIGTGYYTKDFFAAKIADDGTPVWMRGADGGSGDWNFDDAGMDIAVNAFGECYVTGYFRSSEIDFGLGVNLNATNNNYSELFMVRYDSDGMPVYDLCPSSLYDEYGYGIAVKDEGQCFALVGEFRSSSLDILGTVLTNTSTGMEVGDALVFLACDACECMEAEATEWYFGDGAGIDFSIVPPASIAGGSINTGEGSSVIHDADGNMLFYTDGITIWDRDHNPMPGSGSLFGHTSSTQSAIIVPKPCSNHIYYVFTTGYWDAGEHGFNYSIVDMNLRSGMGDVVPACLNMNILPVGQATEKLTAVTHANGSDIWIVTHEFGSNKFMSFLLDRDGLSGPVESAMGSILSHHHHKGGYLAASPDGEYLANALYSMTDVDFELFRLNTETGQVYDMMGTFDHSMTWAYGLAFSPDGTMLYAADFDELMQYDILAETWTTVATNTAGHDFGAIMAGPDGKIYVARNAASYLDVIHDPDEHGVACNYEWQGILLDGTSTLGLPQCYVNSCIDAGFFSETHYIMLGESVQFHDVSRGEIDTWTWTFPGGFPPASNDPEPLVLYDVSGVYSVTLTVTGPAGSSTETKTAYIHAGTTGIPSPADAYEAVSIYPNPASGHVNLLLPDEPCTLLISDMQGRVILQEESRGGHWRSDVGHWPRAVYFLTVIPDDGDLKYHGKIVLK